MKRGIYDFIVEQPKAFNDTIKTQSGFELKANVKFSGKQIANNICKVVATPLSIETEIQPGFEILIDTDIFFTVNTELGGDRPNPNLIDKEKGWYKLSPDCVVLYRENSDSEWIGFQDNVIIEFVKEKPKQMGIIQMPNQQETTSDTIAKVIYSNKLLIENENVNTGDTVALLYNYSVPINFDFKEYFWCKNGEIAAKEKDGLDTVINWNRTTQESFNGKKIYDSLSDEASQFVKPKTAYDSQFKPSNYLADEAGVYPKADADKFADHWKIVTKKDEDGK